MNVGTVITRLLQSQENRVLKETTVMRLTSNDTLIKYAW